MLVMIIFALSTLLEFVIDFSIPLIGHFQPRVKIFYRLMRESRGILCRVTRDMCVRTRIEQFLICPTRDSFYRGGFYRARVTRASL